MSLKTFVYQRIFGKDAIVWILPKPWWSLKKWRMSRTVAKMVNFDIQRMIKGIHER